MGLLERSCLIASSVLLVAGSVTTTKSVENKKGVFNKLDTKFSEHAF